MGDVATAKIGTALLLDAKHWKAQRVNGVARPLADMPTRELRTEGIHDHIRSTFGKRTMGEARDMVGRELRLRTRETGHG